MSSYEAQAWANRSYGRHLRQQTELPKKEDSETPKPDSFWQKEVKAIKEFDDFDVEFGKRFLLALLEKPDGEKKFISFMSRADKAIGHYKELEALDLTDEEEKLFDAMPISRKMDKFLRTKGWKVYGNLMVAGGIIGLVDAVFYYTAFTTAGEEPSYWKTFLSSPYHFLVYPASELLLGALLTNTASHEFDDLKYEELQRAVLSLTEKHPGAFVEEAVRNVRKTTSWTKTTQTAQWFAR